MPSNNTFDLCILIVMAACATMTNERDELSLWMT